jgi:hypothetical protein
MSWRASRPTTCRSSEAYWLSRGRRLALVAAAVIGACGLFAVPALAIDGPPVIESMSASAGGEVTVGADIDPEGLETTYEIWLECDLCDPSDQRASGRLPAVDETRAVTLVSSGLQAGRYWFGVRVVNADGEASRQSESLEVPASPGPFPNGAAPVGVIQAPYLGAGTGELLKIAEQQHSGEQNEQHAKEQEVQTAEERARLADEAAERQRREAAEHAAAAVRMRAHRVCVVPSLRGDTLSAARRALADAHCRLGRVNRPRRHHRTLLVTRQNPRPGKTLPAGSGVMLTLGAEQASHR